MRHNDNVQIIMLQRDNEQEREREREILNDKNIKDTSVTNQNAPKHQQQEHSYLNTDLVTLLLSWQQLRDIYKIGPVFKPFHRQNNNKLVLLNLGTAFQPSSLLNSYFFIFALVVWERNMLSTVIFFNYTHTQTHFRNSY